MNCTSCARPLPEGATFCPTCGASTPYNVQEQGQVSPSAPAQDSSYGSSQDVSSLPPTLPANPNNYPPQAQNGYTDYGQAMPSQAPYNNPYNIPPSYPGGPPPAAGPYYGAPGMPGYPPGIQPGMYGMNQPPKKRSKVGWIIGSVVLALVLVCGGLIVLVSLLGRSVTTVFTSSVNATATATTSTPGTTNTVPTSSDVVPAAAKILFNIQTSSVVDANDYPKKVTSSFPTGKEFYLTFYVDSAGKDGYIKVRWYEDGQELKPDILTHHARFDHGYFGITYTTRGSGAAAIYWCTQSSCSDAQLAQVVHFTVTGMSALPTYNDNRVGILAVKTL